MFKISTRAMFLKCWESNVGGSTDRIVAGSWKGRQCAQSRSVIGIQGLELESVIFFTILSNSDSDSYRHVQGEES